MFPAPNVLLKTLDALNTSKVVLSCEDMFVKLMGMPLRALVGETVSTRDMLSNLPRLHTDYVPCTAMLRCI